MASSTFHTLASTINNALFNFLVTPMGTTTLEILMWFFFFTILNIFHWRFSRTHVSKLTSLKPLRQADKEVCPVPRPLNSLRQRNRHKSDVSDENDTHPENPSKQPYNANCDNQSDFGPKLLIKFLILSYFLDVGFFTMVSLYMRQSILFIPSRCSNSSTSNMETNCDYSFAFTDEYHLQNPSTNDVIHLVYIKGSNIDENSISTTPLLFSHGNSYNLAFPSFVKGYHELAKLGFDVYAWDFPNYGKSVMDPKSSMSMEKFQEAVDFTLLQVGRISGTKPEDIVLWGFSMGAALSSHLAVKRGSKTLVLQFPPDRFDWIVREGTKLTGWFSSLPQHKVLNVFGLLPSIRSPTCIFHLAAEKDVYVTLPRQQQLFDQIPDSVKACSFFVKVSDVGHDGNPLENPDVLLKLRKFYPLSRVQ